MSTKRKRGGTHRTLPGTAPPPDSTFGPFPQLTLALSRLSIQVGPSSPFTRILRVVTREDGETSHAPEWATKIDFSTLRAESTELVSKKTLQRRHPDMIWSADTVDGERVLFLLEFQRTVDRLMALRAIEWYKDPGLDGLMVQAPWTPC